VGVLTRYQGPRGSPFEMVGQTLANRMGKSIGKTGREIQLRLTASWSNFSRALARLSSNAQHEGAYQEAHDSIGACIDRTFA
jgi:hypothetical protein